MHLCREFVFTCKCMCVCVPVCACACVLKICIINIFMALLQFDSLYVHFQLFSLVLYLLRFLTLSVSLPLALSVSFWMQVQLLCAEKRLHFDRRHLHWPNWSPKCWSSSALSLSSPLGPSSSSTAWASSTLSSSPNPSPSLRLTVANCNCSYCSCSWLCLWLWRWL